MNRSTMAERAPLGVEGEKPIQKMTYCYRAVAGERGYRGEH